jgi:diguanylate cyclase (GGDEF)-like protein
VLPGALPDDARVVAERLRREIESSPVAEGDRAIRVTVSIGVAICSGAGTHDEITILEAADACLYEAKERGRNQVVMRQDPARDAAGRSPGAAAEPAQVRVAP